MRGMVKLFGGKTEHWVRKAEEPAQARVIAWNRVSLASCTFPHLPNFYSSTSRQGKFILTKKTVLFKVPLGQ